MGLNIGSNEISDLKLGSNQIIKVYYGVNLIYPTDINNPIEQNYYNFYIADSIFNNKTMVYNDFRIMDSLKNKSKENV